jgi:hypothetical protein
MYFDIKYIEKYEFFENSYNMNHSTKMVEEEFKMILMSYILKITQKIEIPKKFYFFVYKNSAGFTKFLA